MRMVAVAVVGCFVLGACGSTDVTESSEYGLAEFRERASAAGYTPLEYRFEPGG